MRRSFVVAGAVAVFAAAGCGTGTDAHGKPVPTPITAPAAKAKGVVGQQNAQLKQMEQRTGSADPTAAP